MEQIIYHEILPLLIFFVIFSLLFSLLECVVVIFLDHLEYKYWEWVIDKFIAFTVHHKKMTRIIPVSLLALIIVILIIFSPIISVLTLASDDFRLFALLLFLIMMLIYFINLRRTARLAIEKKTYRVLFIAISIIMYVFIITLSFKTYKDYFGYLSKSIITPAEQQIDTIISKRQDKQLLNKFHKMVLDGKCEYKDYTKEQKKILITNTQWIASEPELTFGNPKAGAQNSEESLRGKSCSDGDNTFLLTENGDWYWVQEDYIKYVKSNLILR